MGRRGLWGQFPCWKAQRVPSLRSEDGSGLHSNLELELQGEALERSQEKPPEGNRIRKERQPGSSLGGSSNGVGGPWRGVFKRVFKHTFKVLIVHGSGTRLRDTV